MKSHNNYVMIPRIRFVFLNLFGLKIGKWLKRSSSGDLHSKLRLGVWHSNPASIDKGLFQKQWQWQMTEWSSKNTEE